MGPDLGPDFAVKFLAKKSRNLHDDPDDKKYE